MPNNKPGFFLPLAVFFVFLVILAIAPLWFYIIQYKINKPQPNPASQDQASTPSASTDETANWKIFNSPCGFSLKYPEKFRLEQVTKECKDKEFDLDVDTIKSEDGREFWLNMRVDNNPENLEFDREIKDQLGWQKSDQEETTISGYKAVKLKASHNEQAGYDGYGLSTGAIILKGGKFYFFNVTGDLNAVEVWNQILSTFKFTQ